MRTIAQLWDDFTNKFSNYPTPFDDEIYGDGLTKVFQLTYYPIVDHASYSPQVYVNTGTYATPIRTLKSEGIDYTIDYSVGTITFLLSAPPLLVDTYSEPSPTVKVTANHCKINLKQFIYFYNQAIPSITLIWPRREYQKISQIGTDAEGTEYSNFDITQPPFDVFHTIQEIYQQEDDAKHQVFMKRDNLIYVDIDDNTPDFTYIIGPSDYFRGPFRKSKVIRTPFYIRGILKYPQFDINSYNPNFRLSAETYLDYEKGQTENMLIRIGLQMYQMRQHWSERMNASTLRISTLKEIQGLIASTSMDLQRHTAENAPGRGTLEPLTILN